MSNVPGIMRTIADSGLSKRQLYDLYYRIGDVLGRRMFYQLVFHAAWAPNTPQWRDHTDRFYETMDDLASLIVKSMNYEQVQVESLPTHVFEIDGLNVAEIKEHYHTEGLLAFIMKRYLPEGLYEFEIHQHEVSFV